MSRSSRTHRNPRSLKAAWKVLWALTFSSLLLCPALGIRAEEGAPAKPVAPADTVAAGEGQNDPITLRDRVYYYQAFNQRDPFQSLIAGEFEESGELDIVDIYSVKLVGVLSGGMERYAMLEDNNGYAYIMKAGDPIRNGNIVSVTDQSLIARVSLFGQTSTVTLRLEEKRSKGE